LEIYDDFHYDEDSDKVIDRIIDIFSDDPTPRPLPLLETLTVNTMNVKRGFLSPQILQLLLLAPSIVSCTFENIVRWHDLDVTLEKLVVPTFRRLMPGNRGDAKILDRLSLPRLDVLSVSIAIPGDDLRLFSSLARSSPPSPRTGPGTPM
jgi:hypothetical protein